MAILAMSRRAILALPWLGKPTGKMPVGLMGGTPMPRFHARGNMKSAPKPSAMTGLYTCVYDAWNRLAEVQDGEVTIAKYRYDGLGRRVKSHIDSQAPASPDGVDAYRHFYYNAAWQLLETRKTTTETTAPDTLNPECQYVWSQRYIDAPVLRDENKNSDGDCTDAEDERLYYCTDAQMNVTALVTAAGTVVERYAYDPYGQPIFYTGSWGSRSTSNYGNAILYGGYYYDKETGFYHVRNRMYHAQLGRWMTRDPLGYVDGMSLYEYVGGSPLNASDPAGLWYDKRETVIENIR